MKFLMLFGFVGLLLCFSCGDGDEYANSLLWKIEGPGLEKPSYLFGTVHQTCDAYLKQKVRDALESTDILMLEIHPDEIWSEESDNASEVMSMLPNGKTLHDYMTDEEYNMLRNYLLRLADFDIDEYPTIHPAYLSVYRVPPEMNCTIFDSFERALTDHAYDNDLEFGGLETLEYHYEVLSNMSAEIHTRYVLREARSGKPASNNAIRLTQIHYKNEDLNGIKRIILSDKYTKTWRSNPEVLDERNFKWITKIDSLVHIKPAFFGVGAAHLVGTNGLIRLLEHDGYTLTPIFD